MDKDIGLQTIIMNLLLSYNMQYLKLGLETIFGVVIMRNSSKSLQDSLKEFIKQKFINDDEIKQKYSRTRLGKFSDEYKKELQSIILFRFLILIFILDKCKLQNIIPTVFHYIFLTYILFSKHVCLKRNLPLNHQKISYMSFQRVF